ncbi:MAG: SusD/RagB family nutrient-binding outer membrane lipoprotein [Prevotellaceae bacterium]|jgi:hypothetical protein|nr:SusD/RagB family nutrient-binding outer membrane lipoprotein [Prevotellaceae bacterium]
MKTKFFIIILLASVGISSCSEDIMYEINKNVNNPTDVAARLIITDMINRSAFSVAAGDFALYASVYIEYNVGIWNQMYNAEMRLGEPSSAMTYNNVWNTIYSNLWNLKTIIEKCSPDGNEPNNTVVLGMAQLLTAYNLASLTDMMGDVPWTEALQPGIFWTPQLDKQSDIYNVVNQFIDDAIDNLQKPTSVPAIGAQDIMYSGNASRWLQLANGLKARYAMRLSKISPNYDAVISAANKSFASKSEEAVIKCSASFPNSFYRFFVDRDYFGASQSLLDKLEDKDDPRADVFFKPYIGARVIEFAPNGSPDQVQGFYGLSALSVVTAPIYVMSYHEIEFLKAEAYARKNDLSNASAALKKAVTTCFTNVGLTAAEADDYFAASVQPLLSTQSGAIKEIMMQKYIGLYEIEASETYCDYRRLKAMGEGDIIPLDNPLKFPLRFSYGSEDVTTNVNVRTAYGDGSYVYSENVWWAGGSR